MGVATRHTVQVGVVSCMAMRHAAQVGVVKWVWPLGMGGAWVEAMYCVVAAVVAVG